MKHLNTLVALCLCILGSIGTVEAQTEETVTVNGLTYVIYEIEEWSATEEANVKTKQAFVKEVDSDLTDAIILDSLRHQGISYPVSGTTTYNSQGKEPFREHTALRSVTIPATMKDLDSETFLGCTNLSTITFDPESHVILKGPVFYGCTSLTNLDFPAHASFEPGYISSYHLQKQKGVLYGSGVKHVRFSGEIWPEKNYQLYYSVGAFEDSPELESVELAEGITYIPYRCFINCPKLASVTLPQSLDKVDAGAFGNPDYPNSTGPFMLNQPDGVIYLGNTAYVYKGDIAPGTIIDIRPGTRYISNELLDEKKLAEATIRIPKSVEEIWGGITANMEFEDGNPVYPCIDGVRYADSGSTLADATNLTIPDFTIPSGVYYIDPEAFKNCKALRSLTIPSSVTFPPFQIFLGENVQSLTIQSRNVLRETTFADCPSLKEVIIDCNYNRYSGIEDERFFLSGRVYIGGGEAYLSMNLFSNCPNIETLTFTDGVDYIAPLFNKADSVGIQTLNLPAHVKWIGNGAFRNFTRLKTVTLPRMEMCGNGLFRRCTALEAVNLPDGLTQLGDSTFMDCKSLKEITLPSSVTSIGTAAFSGCSDLTSVNLPSSVTGIGNEAFISCGKLTTINLENVESIGNYCFMWCDSLNEVNAPAFRPGDTYHPMEGSGYSRTGGVYYLGTTACGYDISMPDSVPVPIDIREGTTDIQSFAFSYINAPSYNRRGKTLQYPIHIANSVRNIGKGAFQVLRQRKGFMADLFNLPADVEHIGDEAFSSFTLEDTLFILPANVKSIGNRAFYLSPKDTLRFYVQNAEPCEIHANSFGSSPYVKRRCILYVPAGSKEAYAGSAWAGICKEIREYDSLPTAIHTPATDSSRNIQITPGGIYVGGPARVYSPDGRLVDETRKAALLNLPKRRTYIVTCGGASAKVYVP